VTLTNHSDDLRRLRLTSYGEVVLSQQLNDARHPAFNKLFVESEPLPKNTGLLFHRRPRSKSEGRVYLAHSLVTQPAEVTLGLRSLENDRGRFIGRNTTTRDPAALNPDWQPASGSSPDPIFSISQDVDLPPHSTIRLAYLTAASRTKEGCLANLERYASLRTIERALERARALAEVEMNELEISTSQIEEFQTLLSMLVFPNCVMRPNPEGWQNRKVSLVCGLWHLRRLPYPAG
jgi:cyclic beta-1,2-glucan synthetase